MLKNSSGFSLVSVMVFLGIAGGVAVLVMKLSGNMKSVEDRSTGVMDSRELLTEVRSLLENDKSCKLSLRRPDNSAMTFRKSDVDEPEKEPGLPIELWQVNAAGTERTRKRFFEGASFGRARITSLRLFMDNGTGKDYPEGGLSDLGTMKISYTFEGQGTKILVRDYLVNVSFMTDKGTSTIMGCERQGIQALCESLNMLYNPQTQKCLNPPDECGDFEVLAPEGAWSGWKELGCSKKDGGYVQSMIFSQSRAGTADANGMKIKCCYSKKYEGAQCVTVNVADNTWWTGTKEGFCTLRPRGFVRKIELYQDMGPQDTNGMKIQCCYPQ